MERDYQHLTLLSQFDISTHTLTWSVTLAQCVYINVAENFNSHAHVERDRHIMLKYNVRYISTHTLTWSVTFSEASKIDVTIISTHTLTWSVTGRAQKAAS